MRQYFLSKIIAMSALLFIFQPAINCTNVTYTAKDGSVIVGRSMEFGPDLNSNILVSSVGKTFHSSLPNGKTGKSWQAKYGYIYMDGFGLEFTADGMNSEGLSFGYLYLDGLTEYQKLSKQDLKQTIPYYYLGDWILGNFKTVKQVKSALQDIRVVNAPLKVFGQEFVFPMHAIVTDDQGNSLVIEFVDGQMNIYDDTLGILTNSPEFNWHLFNLEYYAGLSPYVPKPIDINKPKFSHTGQSSGMLGLPGDVSSPSRFIKMAILKQTVKQPKDAQDTVLLVEHMLDTVFIPRGFVRDDNDSQNQQPDETTQWTVIKDLTNHKLYYKSYNNPQLKVIDLDDTSFTSKDHKSIPLDSPLKIQTVEF